MNVKTCIKKISIINRTYKGLRRWCIKQVYYTPPPSTHNIQKYANILYKKEYGRPIDWIHPMEMNEKIRWLQFNSDTAKWTLLADKFLVRQYLEAKGYGHLLPQLYGVWDNAGDIDFDKLPPKFVLKTNHGSGSIIIVKDKNEANFASIRKVLQRDLKTPFGYEKAELHYLKIQPKVFAEELLEDSTGFSKSIIDYKFFCTNGEPYCVGVFYDRDTKTHNVKSAVYDMNWIKHDEWTNEKMILNADVPKPQNLKEMHRICRELAGEFPFVRLDLYEVNNHVYFGEFTFTPCFLSIKHSVLSKLAHEKIGEKIRLQ